MEQELARTNVTALCLYLVAFLFVSYLFYFSPGVITPEDLVRSDTSVPLLVTLLLVLIIVYTFSKLIRAKQIIFRSDKIVIKNLLFPFVSNEYSAHDLMGVKEGVAFSGFKSVSLVFSKAGNEVVATQSLAEVTYKFRNDLLLPTTDGKALKVNDNISADQIKKRMADYRRQIDSIVIKKSISGLDPVGVNNIVRRLTPFVEANLREDNSSSV
jgi:hypothetical protein